MKYRDFPDQHGLWLRFGMTLLLLHLQSSRKKAWARIMVMTATASQVDAHNVVPVWEAKLSGCSYDGWSCSPATLLALTLEMHHFWVLIPFIAKLLSTLWTSSLEAGHELRVRQCHLNPSDITWDLFLVLTPSRPQKQLQIKGKIRDLSASGLGQAGDRRAHPAPKDQENAEGPHDFWMFKWNISPRTKDFSKHAEVKTSHFNAMGLWDVSQHIYFPLRISAYGVGAPLGMTTGKRMKRYQIRASTISIISPLSHDVVVVSSCPAACFDSVKRSFWSNSQRSKGGEILADQI